MHRLLTTCLAIAAAISLAHCSTFPTVSCTDGVQNLAETDVDCGVSGLPGVAGICGLCTAGKKCRANADCKSNLCFNGRCQAPRCDDLIPNGDETDTDCGGDTACDRCRAGQICKVGSDCLSGTCDAGRCAARCGPDGCLPDQTCTVATECESGVCRNSLCKAARCDDNVANGKETDADCGGDTVCKRCTAGQTCKAGRDCLSGSCEDGRCVHTCKNGKQDVAPGTALSSETDVDCGGSLCLALAEPRRCKVGQGCRTAADCESGTCINSVCKQAACDDTIINGSESDVDCGGDRCGPCRLGSACNTASDCVAGAVCANNTCVSAPQSDGTSGSRVGR